MMTVFGLSARRTAVTAFSISATAGVGGRRTFVRAASAQQPSAKGSSANVCRGGSKAKGPWTASPASAAAAPFDRRCSSTLLKSTTADAVSTAPSTVASTLDLEKVLEVTHPAYEVVRRDVVDEYGAYCTLYRHTKSGAEVLSVSNDDDNKVFGIVFRTPPNDSTGVPHILEHSVLCGSRKYTTKDPFVHLLKGSLQTFLNAFTYPDRTCYVVASQNLKDFKNLVNVYMDAVLHPRAVEDPMVR